MDGWCINRTKWPQLTLQLLHKKKTHTTNLIFTTMALAWQQDHCAVAAAGPYPGMQFMFAVITAYGLADCLPEVASETSILVPQMS